MKTKRSIAVGGNTLNLQVRVIGFSGPADLYLALLAPSILRVEIYQIRPNLALLPQNIRLY
jgi:hypothetical protein